MVVVYLSRTQREGEDQGSCKIPRPTSFYRTSSLRLSHPEGISSHSSFSCGMVFCLILTFNALSVYLGMNLEIHQTNPSHVSMMVRITLVIIRGNSVNTLTVKLLRFINHKFRY